MKLQQKKPTLVDLYLPENTRDPYKFYAKIRGENPIFWDYAMQSWVVLGYDEIINLSKSNNLSQDRITPFFNRLPRDKQESLAPMAEIFSSMMLFNDPPKHTRLRDVLRRSFTPKIIEKRRGFIEKTTKEIFWKQGKTMDVIKDFSQPLTQQVIGNMIGVSKEASYLLDDWKSLLNEFFMQSSREVERIENIKKEIEKTIKDRKAERKDDLVSELIYAQLEGAEISNDEVFASLLLLIDAGQVTTTHFIANAVYALIKNPEQLNYLRHNPEKIPDATKELLRFDSSVQFATRMAIQDITIGDNLIKKGDSITLVFGSANHCPSSFSSPDRLDVINPASQHLSFGHGLHHCLGGQLALMEAEIALRELLLNTSDMWILREAELEWEETINFRFLKKLEIGIIKI